MWRAGRWSWISHYVWGRAGILWCERCCESEQKKMRVKKGGAGGNKDLLLASAQECCWGWLTTTGVPPRATDFMVHRQNPGEMFTCLQLPCHSCLFANSKVSSHNLSIYLIPPKMGGSQIHYIMLPCCKAWPLNLPHSFCNNDPTLSVSRLKTQGILSVYCNVIFSTSKQKPDRLMISPLGKWR